MASDLPTGEYDRYRLYALLEALEADLRDLIETYLTDLGDENLGTYLEKAKQNRARDGVESELNSLATYLDLGDEIDVLNEQRELLPPEIAKSFRSFTADLQGVVGCRNRVMHFKPLLPGDLENLMTTLFLVTRSAVPFPRAQELLRSLRQDPAWSPLVKAEQPQSAVLHNLPLPEFDDTGLVGRSAEVRRLKTMLLARRYPAITVLGPGGVGKTALAVQTLHDLVDDASCPYEAVLWVSLKGERLTAEGIQQLREPLEDIAQVVDDLSTPLAVDFSGDISELGEALNGIPSLICIDNLETASGSDILDLIDSCPPDSKFLFTSRVGIGQVERIFELGALEAGSAADLLRRTAKSRGVEFLASAAPEQAAQIVERLSRSPLAIRWFVISVESGQRVNALLENQDDLLQFCVQNVWESLVENGRYVAHVLQSLAKPVSVQELSLYVDESPDDLRSSLHSLQRRALVRLVALGTSELTEAFVPTEVATRYMQRFDQGDAAIREKIASRQRSLLASEERRVQDEGRSPVAPQTVVLVSEVDRPAALLLRDALRFSRAADSTRYRELLAQAREIAPEFYEVDRVEAFVLSSSGEVASATYSFELALNKAPDGLHRARVSYLYSGHLFRNAHLPAEALKHARIANAEFDLPETNLQLAQALIVNAELEPAIALLENSIGTISGKQQRIAATQLMEARRRRAEERLRNEAHPLAAAEECLHAARTGCTFVGAAISDSRLTEMTAQCISEALQALMREPVPSRAASLVIAETTKLLFDNEARFRFTRYFDFMLRNLSTLQDRGFFRDVDPATQGVAARMAGRAAEPRSDEPIHGEIKHLRGDKSFGFVTAAGGEDVFFHFSTVSPPEDKILLHVRAPVAIVASRNDKGQLRAQSTQVYPGIRPDESVLQGRRLEISHFAGVDKPFVFAREHVSGMTVFIHESDLEGTELRLRDLRVGEKLRADLLRTGDGRLRIVSGGLRRTD